MKDALPRRTVLRTAAALALSGVFRVAGAHNSAGVVKPALAVPDMDIVLHTGRKTTLRELLTGRATALQLMFTGCSATCPIQGALFAQVQDHLPKEKLPLQLVSFSIDPLGDTAQAMKKWLARFGARDSWLGVIPSASRVDAWLDVLNGRATGPDRHTGQVFFFDHHAMLSLRTVDFPKPEEVARLLVTLASQVKA
ncbi:SCO family protein [Burkholderia pyrrocinia]|uniref:SCO family protein n=1 Tax=Burkholderia pyrrocinia TaxID=60550 RepID=UPI00158ED12D|nr:SCO family protein [Burkholderia pyrrocinia]